jgi:vacuolar-type H+-ATPase subunit H
MAALKSAWAWIKGHWMLLLVGAGGVASFLLRRKLPGGFVDSIKAIRESEAVEQKAIDDAREVERQAIEKATKRKADAVAAVEQTYVVEQKELDDEKRKEVQKIIQDHGNDPNELAHRLSQATGYKVIMPEED